MDIMQVYEPIFDKQPTYKFLKSGRAAGKSVGGAQKTVKTFFEEEGDIVVFRSNYADIKQSFFQEVMNVVVELNLFKYIEIRQKPLIITHKDNGNAIYFLGIGGADVHRTKGFKPNKELSLIVGEELQQVPAQTNLDEAMATFLRFLKDDGEVLYLFNPDRRASQWVNEYFRIKKYDRNFLCLHTTYRDIAAVLSKHLLTEIEVERITNPSNYRHRYLGETEGLFGAVYSNFDRNVHLVTELQVKDLIRRVGIHQLLVGADPAITRDATALVPVLLLKNGQTIALNYFYHDPQINGVITNANLIPYLKKWLEEDVIKRWELNRHAEIQVVFDTQGADLKNQVAYTFPRNFVCQTYSQKNILEQAHYMQNAFSKNMLFILDEGGYFNYLTNRFVRNAHPLVSQLEQVMWNEAGDGFEKKVPNDCTDALTYAISFYFKNPANLHFPQTTYYYKPLPKVLDKEEQDERKQPRPH